jgi:hypothetical protein
MKPVRVQSVLKTFDLSALKAEMGVCGKFQCASKMNGVHPTKRGLFEALNSLRRYLGIQITNRDVGNIGREFILNVLVLLSAALRFQEGNACAIGTMSAIGFPFSKIRMVSLASTWSKKSLALPMLLFRHNTRSLHSRRIASHFSSEKRCCCISAAHVNGIALASHGRSDFWR